MELRDFFHQRIRGLSFASRPVYRRALDAFLEFCGGAGLPAEAPDENRLAEWGRHLTEKGLSLASIRQNIDVVGSLYRAAAKSCLCPPSKSARLAKEMVAARYDFWKACRQASKDQPETPSEPTSARWHAMRLRRGVSLESFRADIRLDAPDWEPLEWFYPSQEVVRVTRGKVREEDQPVIRDVVFFRLPQESIAPLFHRMGDRAWCYRLTNTPAAPYATIPDTEMARFQEAIGIFLPSSGIQPVGTIPLRPGEKVMVIGTEYKGQEGVVERAVKEAGQEGAQTAVIRILLTTDLGFEWRVDLDPRLLKRLD